MYGYLYCENGGLKRLPDKMGFVPNLNINAEICFFYVSKTLLDLRAQARACVRIL